MDNTGVQEHVIKYFICAHKPIKDPLPKSDVYTILDVSGTVKDDSHNIIDISKDPFTKSHNVCYSEGSALRWMMNNSDLLPEYVVFGHYRRIFLDFVDKEYLIPNYVDKYGAIIMAPYSTYSWGSKNNSEEAIKIHPHTKIFYDTVVEVFPDYKEVLEEHINSDKLYACNLFAMKKEHFLEMSKISFQILDRFDEKMGYMDNNDVFRDMIKFSQRKHLPIGINWQARLQGFFLEYLTDIYFRWKFGVQNCYHSEIGLPENKVLKYEFL